MAEAGYAIAALEPSAGRRRMLAGKLRRAPAYIGGFEAIDGALVGSFDVAMAFEVVEHVLAPDLPAFFATFDRALAPGGRLIMSTPNREDMAASTMVSPREGCSIIAGSTFAPSTAKFSAALLDEHGFEVDVIHEIDAAAMDQRREPLFQAGAGGHRAGVPRRCDDPVGDRPSGRRAPRRRATRSR